LLTGGPTSFEQASLELLNHMRMDPQGELPRLFSTVDPSLTARDPSVQFVVDLYRVSGPILASQFSSLRPVAPLAWSDPLHVAALNHNTLMSILDQQSHQLPNEPPLGQRIAAAGYAATSVGENVYAYANSALFGHAGFAVDWKPGAPGIQNPPSHRNNIMSSMYHEVGISILEEYSEQTAVGPFLITQNFGARSNYQPQLLGVVWDDLIANGFYDPGEGVYDVQIVATGPAGTFTTTTMGAGGYQMPLPPGTYQVTASGGSLTRSLVTRNVVIGSSNVKVDFEAQTANVSPVANNDQVFIDERGYASISVLANDVSTPGGFIASSVHIVEPPLHGVATRDMFSGTIFYRADPGYAGPDSFTYQVLGTEGGVSNPATVQVTTLYRQGDFDRSGRVTGHDIDLLFAELARPTANNSRFDLNGDRRVNYDDVDYLVHDVLRTDFGDANLDRRIDMIDFAIWSVNRFSIFAGTWSRGDFNGDHSTDVADFHIWLENKSQGILAAGAADIPPDELLVSDRVLTSIFLADGVPTVSPGDSSRVAETYRPLKRRAAPQRDPAQPAPPPALDDLEQPLLLP
jgi:hypothetical protein